MKTDPGRRRFLLGIAAIVGGLVAASALLSPDGSTDSSASGSNGAALEIPPGGTHTIEESDTERYAGVRWGSGGRLVFERAGAMTLEVV